MNLPKTGFPMRAGLSKSEPKRLKDWQDNKVYEQVLKKNEGHKKFVLHDGPPYANGPIHLGHAQNKISKDMINRYWMMQGCEVPYVPGWDCHGQPIEHKVEEMLGDTQIDDSVLATEITVFADKICVDEETVRLRSHIEGMKKELLAGGSVGSIMGAVIGAFIMGILNNGMSLYGWSTDIQKIVKGAVLLGAVTVDVLSKRKKG